MKTHFNSLKRLVEVTALAALAVKLLTVALTAVADGPASAPARAGRPGTHGSSTSAEPRPGGCSGRAAHWSWRRRSCRRGSGSGTGPGGCTPPSACCCSPPWPWPRPGRRGTWSGRPCSATWGTPAGASIYAVAAGACVGWTSTRSGTGLPWAAGVAPGTVPDGTIAGLGLVTWVVLGSWLFLGGGWWRSRRGQGRRG